MFSLKIYPLEKTISVRRGESLADAFSRTGVELDSPCSGDGVCGKCRVRVLSPAAVQPTPHRDISDTEQAEGIRLSCQLVPDSDMTVQLLSGATEKATPLPNGATGEGFCGVHTFEGGHKGPSPKGLAIDLGTTTIEVSLVSLSGGTPVFRRSVFNPQVRYGHDVLRRIAYASSPEGLEALSSLVRQAINSLVEKLCQDAGIFPAEIMDGVIAGNTAMLQIAAGIDPSPLQELPFTVGIESGCKYPVSRFGINAHPKAEIYVPPIVHAYVGADISAGLLLCPDFFRKDVASLFVDVGTNGEIVVNANGRLLMTSAAAGPAFEGMGISAGMRACGGAIEAVTADSGDFAIYTIGNAAASGICGSGIIDFVSIFLETGVLDSSGRMKRFSESGRCPKNIATRLVEQGGSPSFRINDNVCVTQKDVRQVQLAKSAIRTGIDILLAEAGVVPDRLDSIVLAGGFGRSLRPSSLEGIGMIPPGTGSRLRFAGNTSMGGCVRMLQHVRHRHFLERRMKQVEHVTIETRPDFMERFVAGMSFPESKASLKPVFSNHSRSRFAIPPY